MGEGGGGGGEGGIPMEGMFVEMDRVGFLTHGKRQSINQCAYCQY